MYYLYTITRDDNGFSRKYYLQKFVDQNGKFHGWIQFYKCETKGWYPDAFYTKGIARIMCSRLRIFGPTAGLSVFIGRYPCQDNLSFITPALK